MTTPLQRPRLVRNRKPASIATDRSGISNQRLPILKQPEIGKLSQSDEPEKSSHFYDRSVDASHLAVYAIHNGLKVSRAHTMGRHRILNLLLLPAMLLAVSTSAQEAAAGYIAPGVGQQDALSSLSGMSSSATESEATRSLVTLTDWIHHVASPTPGGMTPQSTTATSPSSAPSALPLAAEPLATTQLIIWLGPSGKIWLPPPFSTGIFRPPRYVG